MTSGNQGERGRSRGRLPSAVGGTDKSARFDLQHCFELLAGQTYGRISFSAMALPAIMPVRYWLDDDQIYLQLGSDQWLPQMQNSQVVLLQIDQISAGSMRGWQVTATGVATPLFGERDGGPGNIPAHLEMQPQLVTGHPVQFD
jgi:hypothetical protein